MINCDICGRYISYEDIEKGLARVCMVESDNAFGPEVMERLCPLCNPSNVQRNQQELLEDIQGAGSQVPLPEVPGTPSVDDLPF